MIVERDGAGGRPILAGVTLVWSKVEWRNDVSPFLVFGDGGEEDGPVVTVVALVKKARHVDGDLDVGVRVAIRTVTQCDLVQRVRLRRTRRTRGDTQDDQCHAERHRRDSEDTAPSRCDVFSRPTVVAVVVGRAPDPAMQFLQGA